MEIFRNHSGRWIIMHGGKEVVENFESENAAYSWADRNIDDQVFDEPNWFSPPIAYRTSGPQ